MKTTMIRKKIKEKKGELEQVTWEVVTGKRGINKINMYICTFLFSFR